MNGDPIDSLSFGVGKYRFGATGGLVITLVMLGLVVAANLWGGYLVQQEVREQTIILMRQMTMLAADHKEMIKTEMNISRAQDRTACILSLTQSERTEFRTSRQDWSRWCSWVDP